MVILTFLLNLTQLLVGNGTRGPYFLDSLVIPQSIVIYTDSGELDTSCYRFIFSSGTLFFKYRVAPTETLVISYEKLNLHIPTVYRIFVMDSTTHVDTSIDTTDKQHSSLQLTGVKGISFSITPANLRMEQTLTMSWYTNHSNILVEGNFDATGEDGTIPLNSVEDWRLRIERDDLNLEWGTLNTTLHMPLGDLPVRDVGIRVRKSHFTVTHYIQHSRRSTKRFVIVHRGEQGPFKLSTELILPGSELVRVNHVVKSRVHDYYLDYNEGNLYFTANCLLQPGDTVTVVFDVLDENSTNPISYVAITKPNYELGLLRYEGEAFPFFSYHLTNDVFGFHVSGITSGGKGLANLLRVTVGSTQKLCLSYYYKTDGFNLPGTMVDTFPQYSVTGVMTPFPAFVTQFSLSTRCRRINLMYGNGYGVDLHQIGSHVLYELYIKRASYAFKYGYTNLYDGYNFVELTTNSWHIRGEANRTRYTLKGGGQLPLPFRPKVVLHIERCGRQTLLLYDVEANKNFANGDFRLIRHYVHTTYSNVSRLTMVLNYYPSYGFISLLGEWSSDTPMLMLDFYLRKGVSGRLLYGRVKSITLSPFVTWEHYRIRGDCRVSVTPQYREQRYGVIFERLTPVILGIKQSLVYHDHMRYVEINPYLRYRGEHRTIEAYTTLQYFIIHPRVELTAGIRCYLQSGQWLYIGTYQMRWQDKFYHNFNLQANLCF